METPRYASQPRTPVETDELIDRSSAIAGAAGTEAGEGDCGYFGDDSTGRTNETSIRAPGTITCWRSEGTIPEISR